MVSINLYGASFTRLEASLLRRVCVRALQACLVLPALAGAQSARDSTLYLRAQQMVANGDAAGGRKLADSVANAAPSGTAAYAEGLYWRATLAANARDSEQAYRQIIVDYPLSGRVADALLRIGQLESARGENAAALQHFQRLVLEHPRSPLRAEASYWVARLYFDANDPSHACAANSDALASAPASNVELKNRIDFQQQRCRGVTLATNAPAAAAAPEAVPVKNVPATSAPKPPVKPAPKVAAAASEVAKESTNEAAKKASGKSATERRDTIAKRAAQASTPASTPAAPSAPSETASVASATAAAPSANATSGGDSNARSGVVSRPPTKEEVDRALASAAQSKLLKKTPASAAAAASAAPKAVAKRTAASPARRQPSASIASSASSAGGYAVQIAAFRTKAPATQMATSLHGRGYEAYVDGTSAPYRVRIGHFTTRAAAAQELAKLKARHIDGFVAER
jgi:cell division septation protein DedD/tetratricopeptide (TPR) repeat protein